MRFSTTARFALTAALLAFAPFAQGETLRIDPSQSQIRWVGKKVIGQQHDGTVSVQDGQVEFAGNQLKGGEISIDMRSIKNDDLKDAAFNAKLTGHLKSDDFFGVDQHPTAKFKIKSVKALKGHPTATHEISGDLNIKGVTQPAKFAAKVELQAGASPNDKARVARAQGKLTVDRTRYNIRYGSGKFFENLGDKMISDDFELEIDLKAKN